MKIEPGMLSKTCIDWIKKNWVTTLLTVFIAVMVVSPNAKSWVLEQLVSIGLFRAEIKKEDSKGNEAATSFNFTSEAGVTTSTSSLIGKVIFINFWASWCPPCRAEMPSLHKLYKKLKDDNRFVFLFINEDDDKTKAKQYLQKSDFTISLFGRIGEVPSEIFSGTLPTTIVIDKQGKVVLHHTGMAGYNTDAFIKQLKELL
jgi:thiol-disulfide isomerase/thioredoxin